MYSTSMCVHTVQYIDVCMYCTVHRCVYVLYSTSMCVRTVQYINVCTYCTVHQCVYVLYSTQRTSIYILQTITQYIQVYIIYMCTYTYSVHNIITACMYVLPVPTSEIFVPVKRRRAAMRRWIVWTRGLERDASHRR